MKKVLTGLMILMSMSVFAQQGEPTGSSEKPLGCILQSIFETEGNGHFGFSYGNQVENYSATTLLKCISAAQKQLNYFDKKMGKALLVELSYRDDKTIFSGTFEQIAE